MKLFDSARGPTFRFGGVMRWLSAAALAGWAQASLGAFGETSNTLPPRTPESSLVILPVRLVGRPAERVSEVVALLLERKGLVNVDLAAKAFEPALGAEDWTASLREHLRRNPVRADYVLYVEFNGSRETGLNGLRAALADAAGNIVWIDRKNAGSPAFRTEGPLDPMAIASVLVNDLAPQFGLDAITERQAKPGKFAWLMEQRSGLPPLEERAALLERQRTFAEFCGDASILVYPARIRNDIDTESASYLARALSRGGIGKPCAVAAPLKFDVARAEPNELKALWDMARAFRAHLKNQPGEADYALYVEYAYSPERWEHGMVHLVLCDARGEWVIVDLQNAHHADYRALKPTSKDDCSDLVVRRIQHYIATALQDASLNVGEARPFEVTIKPVAQLSSP